MASYNIFNYNYRPAKSIERKLFVELLKEIYGISPGNDCSYIGLGSVFFSDFKMIHKELGINNLVNIEKNKTDKKRFEFNKPFSCIKLEWGDTTDVLPTLDWKSRKIIWLDYDQSLQSFMFDDIDFVFTNAIEGSFYFMSCNSGLNRYTSQDGNHKLNQFENDFDGLVPNGIKKESLSKNQSVNLIYEMIKKRIEHNLDLKNVTLIEKEKLLFHQMLYITYQDGAPMISIGGYIMKKSNHKIFLKKRINKFLFVRLDDKPLDLISPIVTTQELDLMNNYLPKSKKQFLNIKKIDFIPIKDRTKYQSTYRYFPNFVEIRD
ncbi:O-methyltransferase [Polaribacter sp. Hel_I_88]|uniref:O-methyltransferase n=1 Tax=Polaribacter sp. Hel_I_88 TaxID=1250006 RepID=UPI00047CD166|nr:O-methyltransferase [Polaribacter sp. Hel_I_88]